MDRFVALEDLNKEFAIVEGWAGAVRPLIRELPVLFLQIVEPQLSPREVESGKVAIAIQKHGDLPIGYCRRGGKVTLLVEAVANSNFLVPQDLTRFPVKAERVQRFSFFVGRADENSVIPNNRRGG